MIRRRNFFASLAALGAGIHTSVASADEQPATAVREVAFTSAARGGNFRHRQAFAAQHVSNGAVFAFVGNALNGFQFGWSEGPGTFHPAAVFYGYASSLALDDWAWDNYPIRELLTMVNDPVAAPNRNTGNPFHNPTSTLRAEDDPEDEHGFYFDRSIVALQRRGATFYACNNAVRLVAKQLLATRLVPSGELNALHAKFRAHLVPGAILVPAGVVAVAALQEQGYTFFPAS